MKKKSSILILGGGVAGCTAAHLLNEKGYKVTLLESAPYVGGGVWTRYYGGHPYTFGPRIFFTEDIEVIKHITKLIKIRQFFTKTCTYVEKDQKLYNYPLQYEDLPLMPDYDLIKNQLDKQKIDENFNNFEEYWINSIGPNLYDKFVNDYSKKMWGVESNKQLTADFKWVNRGTPIRDGDNRLYKDLFQGYPENMDGYNSYFLKCVEDIDLITNCNVKIFDNEKNTIITNKDNYSADIIINTLHVDSLFGYTYGKLKYCGRTFIPLWLPSDRVFPDDITWIHYSGNELHTRVTDFKKITNYNGNGTLLGIEIPSEKGRYYPLQSQSELKRFELYKTLYPDNFFSIGRPGKFMYQGIPESIRDAIDLSKII